MAITRKNEVFCKGIFRATDGSVAAPTSAQIVLVYMSTLGIQAVDTLPMTLQADGITWQAVWDSSSAVEGNVDWSMTCWGGLKGARDGSFQLLANNANMLGG